jgi:hypothetical protein
MPSTLEIPIVREVRTVVAERFNLAGDASQFTSRFIEPGLVSYRNSGGGLELLRKETIDRCLGSAIGNPVTIKHVPLTEESLQDGTNGRVMSVEYNAADGWYYAKGTIESETARSLIRRGQRPSCAYAVLSFGPGGKYHGIEYDKEITDLVFHHLAIVEKPRYEGATFRLNAITVTNPSADMNIFKFFKKLGTPGPETTKIEETQVAGDTTVEIDGVPVRLNELAETWKAQSKQVFNAGLDDEIVVDGKNVKVNELVSCYQTARKNEADAKAKKDEEERKNAAEKEEKEKKERENSAETPDQKKAREEKEKLNSLASTQPFSALHNARENATQEEPQAPRTAGCRADRIRRGQERFGSTVAVTPGKN